MAIRGWKREKEGEQMKLEVGMYVRYISGFHHNKSDKPIVMIGKILRVDDYINLDTFFGGGVYPTKEFEKFIKGEPSHNIIDLIEEGDYVNGSKVSIVESEFIYWETGNAIHHKYIENIVTKEQFSQMEYKVGE